MRVFWLVLGCIALGLGMAGTVVPLLPTTVFILLAAAAFAKSSPGLHRWLTRHPVFGAVIADWHRDGAIAPKAKRAAVLTMAGTFLVSLVIGFGWVALAVQAAVLIAVGGWIWTRPDAVPR
jgi:uncharacterized protein